MNQILNIRGIDLKHNEDVDTLELSNDEINKIRGFLSIDLFGRYINVSGDLEYYLYFNIERSKSGKYTTRKIDYQLSNYRICFMIFKLEDDYYQLNWSFYIRGSDNKYHYQNRDNRDEMEFTKYFDQLSGLKKCLNKLSMILSS
jgi:hypothetical protein